jgi:hypothetical protein
MPPRAESDLLLLVLRRGDREGVGGVGGLFLRPRGMCLSPERSVDTAAREGPLIAADESRERHCGRPRIQRLRRHATGS